MNTAVIVFPGSNRDGDVATAIEAVTGKAPLRIWHTESRLPALDLIVLPGGFSYGDYLRTGAIAARSPVMRAVAEAAARRTPIIGICNGFQILCEAGLLPGILMRNAGLSFVCKDVNLRVDSTASVFTRAYADGQVFACPIAHGEGNYVVDDETLEELQEEDRIAFRYVDAAGTATPESNPNGSMDNIAGILSERRNILGLMPHPEDMIEPAQGGAGGKLLFQSIIERSFA